uniref:Uncharacterized protein n=1 Tax=Solanum tuberosum TaxID=4113 RepID=M1DZ50_SOLTU
MRPRPRGVVLPTARASWAWVGDCRFLPNDGTPTYGQPRRKAKQQASQPRRKAKGVVIATEVATPQTTLHKPPQASGKNQVLDDTSSNDSMEIDSIQFTSSISKNEEVVGSGTPIYTLVPEAKMTKRKVSPLHSKATHDPLALPSAPQASQAPQVPHVPVNPPWSMNHLKDARFVDYTLYHAPRLPLDADTGHRIMNDFKLTLLAYHKHTK